MLSASRTGLVGFNTSVRHASVPATCASSCMVVPSAADSAGRGEAQASGRIPRSPVPDSNCLTDWDARPRQWAGMLWCSATDRECSQYNDDDAPRVARSCRVPAVFAFGNSEAKKKAAALKPCFDACGRQRPYNENVEAGARIRGLTRNCGVKHGRTCTV